MTSAGPEPLKLEIRTLLQGGVRVVAIAGDVVVETAAQLEAELAAAPEDSGDVVLDLSEVPFMDSTGLRVVLSARDAAVAAGGRLVVVVVPDGQVEGLLDFMEVKRRLPTAASREQALSDLGSRE